MKLILLFSLMLPLNILSQEQNCEAKYINVGFNQLEQLTTPFFKILSYYTKDSKYDPSADLIYFTALNFYLKNNLTYAQNKEMESIMDKVPGKTEYLAPTTADLIPHMFSFLKRINANTQDKDAAIEKANLLMEKMKKILPEVQGGNRVIYRVIENEHQKIVRVDGDQYIVRVDDCPVLHLMDMHDYLKFTSKKDERDELKNRINNGDILEFLKTLRDEISDQSYFKSKLIRFISENEVSN